MNLVNDSQFAKILSDRNVCSKYFECRAEVICQFITPKSLVAYIRQNFAPPIFHHVRYIPNFNYNISCITTCIGTTVEQSQLEVASTMNITELLNESKAILDEEAEDRRFSGWVSCAEIYDLQVTFYTSNYLQKARL